MAANILADLASWSITDASNQPDTTDPADIVSDLRRIQSTVRKYLATATTLAAASTTDLSTAAGNVVTLTGTAVTITGFGTVSAGMTFTIIANAAHTLTYNATSMILPGAADLTLAAGDILTMTSAGSGNWRCENYLPAVGYAKLVSPSFTTPVLGVATATSINGISLTTGAGGAANNFTYGGSSLENNTTGLQNNAFGLQALSANTTGSYNNAFGVSSLLANTTGANNTAVGNFALSALTTFTNCSGLGSSAAVTASNQVQLGNSSTTTYVYGTVQNRSDLRDKADVRDTLLGLEFIKALRPVDYKWDLREDYKPPMPAAPQEPGKSASKAEKDAHKAAKEAHKLSMKAWIEAAKPDNLVSNGTKKRSRYHHGLIAQEVRSVIAASGVDFGGLQDHKLNGGHDVLSIGYDELIAPLIKAVQELAAKVSALEAK